MKRNATGSIALETLLGWIICGKPHSSPNAEATGVLLTKVEEPTDAALRKFWEIEAMGITPEDDVAPEDTRIMERFEKSLSFNGERYQIGFLWSEGQPDLLVNVKQAMRRLTMENHKRNPLIPPGEERTSKHATCALMAVQTIEEPLHPGRYGDIERLFRISAYCRRFAKNCRSSVSERHSGNLTAWELHEAEEMWIRRTQEEEFQAEIQALAMLSR
ncbi:UvrABC system protein [Trichinella pseudospiralis]